MNDASVDVSFCQKGGRIWWQTALEASGRRQEVQALLIVFAEGKNWTERTRQADLQSRRRLQKFEQVDGGCLVHFVFHTCW